MEDMAVWRQDTVQGNGQSHNHGERGGYKGWEVASVERASECRISYESLGIDTPDRNRKAPKKKMGHEIQFGGVMTFCGAIKELVWAKFEYDAD